MQSLNREVNALILKAVKEDGGGEEPRRPTQRNLLQAILRSASESLECSDRFVVDNCKNIYFAGHETTAVAASWCLMLLALYPEWQARARAEVMEVCGRGGRSLDANALQEIKIVSIRQNFSFAP